MTMAAENDKGTKMNETCMKHELNMPDIGGCPYCRIAELEPQLADERHNCADLALQVAKLEQQLTQYQSKYNNLLAVAHRDGGQYLAQHGEEKAGEAAITAILAAYHNNDRYQGAVELGGWVGIDSISGDQCIRVASKELIHGKRVRALVKEVE